MAVSVLVLWYLKGSNIVIWSNIESVTSACFHCNQQKIITLKEEHATLQKYTTPKPSLSSVLDIIRF